MSIHFAVVTLVATGLLALFAEGERSQATDAIAAPAQPAEDAISKAAHGEIANRIVIRRGAQPQGSFGEDVPHFGSTGSTDYANASATGYEPGETLPRAPLAASGNGGLPTALPATLPPGMTLEEWLARHEEHGEDVPRIQLSPEDLRAMGAVPATSSAKPTQAP